MDRSGGYSEEENVQLKIYSDQDTHGMAAWVIIFALVFCGLMYYDSGETRWELIERVVLGGSTYYIFDDNTSYVCCVL